jgi:endonuclease YncB( thermonuclease family)
MPINRKRRIFRATASPSRGTGRGMVFTILTAGLVLTGGTWFGLQPGSAPASTSPPGHLEADAAQTRVIDGNTLILRDRTVQLAGVRAALRGGVCQTADGTRFDCGAAAANALAEMLRGTSVDCALNGAGDSGRPLAMCSAGGRAINLTMVANGWARAEPGVTALIDAERSAEAGRKGLWAGSWTLAE